MKNSQYGAQHRGDRGAYARYLRGMDASMRQKVALTAAHLLCHGKIADMGMGSGTGSHALAALYPALDVVGVDVSETMVELARERYQLPNLSFVVGDVADPVFEPHSLHAIFDSSVMHHVTTFSGYDYDAAARCLAIQAGELRDHGVLIVRDFVDPGREDVMLDLPETDGDGSDDPTTCSSAMLFERFAREFRSLSDHPGFELTRIPDAPNGFRRYRVSHKLAAEFVLRKDYRPDWEAEVQEEYTYYTQDEYEAVFAELGLRVLASTPIRNPWIVHNRFEGKFELRRLDGQVLDFPPTNYIIVGEKVPAGEGVRFREAGPQPPLGFLVMSHHRHAKTGKVMDLVRRPNLTLDVVPWFTLAGDLFVLARMAYPRPLLRNDPGETVAIDGSRAPGYATEPLSVIQGDRPIGQTVEHALEARAGVPPDQIRGFAPGSTYYPSPGGVIEEVRSVFVEVEPAFVRRPLDDVTGFSTSGRVGAIEAHQLLRAGAVGGLADARLELNVYELLLRRNLKWGPWIGAAIELPVRPRPTGVVEIASLERRRARREFCGADASESTGFLELRCARFEELDRNGEVLHARTLELVTPRTLSSNTVATALLRRDEARIYIGLDDDDLPAAQCIRGNSQLLVALRGGSRGRSPGSARRIAGSASAWRTSTT